MKSLVPGANVDDEDVVRRGDQGNDPQVSQEPDPFEDPFYDPFDDAVAKVGQSSKCNFSHIFFL